VPSPNEDHASMAATAALRLMEKQIYALWTSFRIDTPTESSLDNARALVSDVIGMLEQIYGEWKLFTRIGLRTEICLHKWYRKSPG